ncbi:MAG TPA: hypothetical protein VNW47_00950 [Terriglobales bacterium]|jgi:hypothetical protein|nr:hypothetical protein [Terriglobales bacterium]
MRHELRQSVSDLLDNEISEEEFLRRAGVSRADAGNWSLDLLEDAYRTLDSDGVMSGLFVGFRFGFLPNHLDVLCRLSEAEWHFSHENVVSALDNLRDQRAVDVLYRASLKLHPYLAYDDCRALAVKAIWALGNLRDETADEKLRMLAQRDEKILREAALNQLRRRLENQTAPG